MNTSEEMGQDRDTRIHVIFSVLKIDNPHLAFATASYASRRNVREKKKSFGQDLNFETKLSFRYKISFLGAQAKVMSVVHGGRSCS